jgi:methionine synthase II (cobalamin-independent)
VIAPLATTGVGSLPFRDAPTAVRHAVRAYDIPFCPQLPAHDGDMIREWLGADPRRCGWSVGRDRERPTAWEAFLGACAEHDRRLVKLQVTGPVTLAIALERAAGRRGQGRAIRELASDIALWLAVNAAGQVEALADRGIDSMLLVDEPGLAHAGLDPRDADAVHVWDPFRNTGATTWGLHVCGPVPWQLVRAVRPGVLSFDAVRHPPPSDPLPPGMRIAWGVIDASAPENPDAVAARARACLAATGVAPERSLLTPSCGTGRLSPARERLVAAVLGAAVDLVRPHRRAPRCARGAARYRRT